MPSFFKNIKNIFAKPTRSAQPKNKTIAENSDVPAKISTQPANEKTKHKKPKSNNDRQSLNPFMDDKRAAAINVSIIAESQHKINYKDIDRNAIKIVSDLQRANYESYLVGGCVRDLLLKKKPKDFDVTTGAHPEQAHKVFNRSRLIGRRFKLLHVRFGREIIEVATFRAAHELTSEKEESKQADSGMILRDNVYGTIDQDAIRRDFTINALYFDINTRSIYDFTNGLQDIQDKKVRMIGDPNERYREDPVRMLRAIRFAAKLDFDIEDSTAKPIKELAPMLFDIAPARLFDEVLKLLQSGHGNQSLALLREYNLLETILPQTAEALDNQFDYANELIFNALQNTDRRLKQRKSVSPGFLYAVLLWPSVQHELNQILSLKRVAPLTALHEAASKVISVQVKHTSIPKRFSTNIKEIWELQLRLTRRLGNKAEQFIEHPRFRAAYDLLVLREKSGEDLEGISTWWTNYQSANAEQKQTLVDELNSLKPKKKNRKPAKKTPKKATSFEKFDVVEQVQASKKQLPEQNKPVIEESTVKTNPPKDTSNESAVVTNSIPSDSETTLVDKSNIDTKVDSDPVSTTETQTNIASNTLNPEDEPTSKNIAIDNDSEKENGQIEETPLERKPRKKRGRAKNDPRNK